MKKLFITLGICICIVITVFIVTRTRSTDTNIEFNDNNDNNNTNINYDVYQMLEDVKNISNIYVESELSDGSRSKIYIKDSMKKVVSDDQVSIYDIKENKLKAYKLNDKKGIVSNLLSEISTDYSNACEHLLNNKDDLEYELVNEKIENINCIKVTFKAKKSKNVIAIVWFELENNLIIKTQGDENENVFTKYENIQLNSVTDEDFSIPNDVQLTYVNNN